MGILQWFPAGMQMTSSHSTMGMWSGFKHMGILW